MDSGQEHWFSAKFRLPGVQLQPAELEPRLFSFNNPMGACPGIATAWGRSAFFDPKRVVAHPELSLAAPARGEGLGQSATSFIFRCCKAWPCITVLTSTPVRKPAGSSAQRWCYGSGSESIPFIYLERKRQQIHPQPSFEGILPNFERRYRRKPTPARCAKNWSKYQTASPAQLRRLAPACRRKRAMCWVGGETCTPSTNGRSSKTAGFETSLAFSWAKAGSGRKNRRNQRPRCSFW